MTDLYDDALRQGSPYMWCACSQELGLRQLWLVPDLSSWGLAIIFIYKTRLFVPLLRKAMENMKVWINLRVSNCWIKISRSFYSFLLCFKQLSPTWGGNMLSLSAHLHGGQQKSSSLLWVSVLPSETFGMISKEPCKHIFFLHLAVWYMFPCHHFWCIHFTHNERLSLRCLKSNSKAVASAPVQRPSNSGPAGCF